MQTCDVRGQHLRAGNKPLEGHLVVDSNGGTGSITVRLEVPAKPFPNGVLAGATTPRQIAEKAHAAPKEAAALFGEAAMINLVELEPDAVVALHSHPHEQLGLIVRGSMTLMPSGTLNQSFPSDDLATRGV